MDVQYGSARRTPAPRSGGTAANRIPLGARPRGPNIGGAGYGGGNLLPPMPPGPARPQMGAMGMDPGGMRAPTARPHLGQPPRPLLVSPMYGNTPPGGRAVRPKGNAASFTQGPNLPSFAGFGTSPPTRNVRPPGGQNTAQLSQSPMNMMPRMPPHNAPVPRPRMQYGNSVNSQSYTQGFHHKPASYMQSGNTTQMPPLPQELFNIPGFPPVPKPVAAPEQRSQSNNQRFSSPNQPIPETETPKKKEDPVGMIDIEKYSKLVGWDRLSRAPDDVVVGLLNAIYDSVTEMSDLTSEKRIHELVKLLKEYLTLLLVPTYEFQKYFEQYLNRLIKDQKWISMTTAQALCISVATPDDDSRVKKVNRKFFCSYCTLSYSSAKFTCQFCLASFKHVSDLQAHEFEAHNKVSSFLYVCEICQQSFPQNPMQLRDHMYERHICSRKHFECPYGCEKLILEMSQHSYKDHIKAVHQCSKCKDVVQGSMDEHNKMFHNEERARKRSPSPERKRRQDSREKSRTLQSSLSRDKHGHGSERSLRQVEREPDRDYDRGRDVERGRGMERNRDYDEYEDRRKLLPRDMERNRRFDDYDDRKASPPRMMATNRMQRGFEDFEKFNTSKIDDTELAKAQQTLREMQRAKELLEASERSSQELERFDYVDPPVKGKWPQCKTCKLQQPPGGFRCTKCNLVLSHRVFLFKHMQEVHQMLMPNSFECEMCPKVFSSLSILIYHVNKEAHSCTSDHLQCTYGCLNLFQNKHSLDAHTTAKHEFMCHICEAPVVNQTKKRHFAIYHPGEKVTAPPEVQTPIEQVEVASFVPSASHNEANKSPKTLILAPRTHNNMRQSYLNLASNRQETLLLIPPPLLDDKSFASKTKTQLINMGFMHCKSCEIIYHPVLVSCKLCGETLLNNNCLNEHLVEVHKQKEIVGFKECAVLQCGAKLPNYKMLINHQIEHFCREHTECPFGCKQLIAGNDSAVIQHCIKSHPNKEIPKFSTVAEEKRTDHSVSRSNDYVSLHKLHKESELHSRPNNESFDMDVEVCLKCITCSFMCFEDSIRTCDICPADDPFKCGDIDELKWHLASVHNLFIHGDFVCVPCSNKNHTPVKFTDDVMRFLDHRHKAHGVCKVHERCPNAPCSAIFDPKSPDAERHVKYLCQFLKEVPQPEVTEGVSLETTGWRMCMKCKFSAEITKIYTCVNCERVKMFYVKEEYYAHLVMAHSWKTQHIFSCFVCNSQFGTNAKAWLNHREQNKSHSMCDQHVICDTKECIWMAPNRSEIETHRKAGKCEDHKLDRIIRETKICHVCSQIFSDGVIFQCVLCLKNKQQFVSVLEYLVHIENIHDRKVAGQFDCLECRSYTAMSPYELSRHNYTKHKKCQSHKFCPNSSKCPVMFPFESYNMMHQCAFVNESPIKSLESPSKSPSSRKVSVCASLSDARKLTTVEMDAHDTDSKVSSRSIIISKVNDKAVEPIGSPERSSETRTLGRSARWGAESSKFFEGIGAPTQKPSEPVKVIRILPKTVINIDEDSSDEKEVEKAKEKSSNGEVRLPDRYKIAKEGKTKLFVCSHCNYQSILPPPGKFKGDMKCKQRNCGLIFHQKFELVSHLELAHDKPLPPVKFKITCEFCRDEKVKVPFAHNLSIPLCEHRKLVHGCCRTHIVCPEEKCSTLLPTRDALEKHLKDGCCETLYVALEGDSSSSEKLDSWKKQSQSNSSEKSDSWAKRGESTGSEKSDSWSKRGESLSAWKKLKPSSDKPQEVKTVIDIDDDDLPPPPKVIDVKSSKIDMLVLKYGSKDSQSFKLYECLECARKFACMTIYRCNQCPDSISLSSRSFVNLVEFFAHLKDAHQIDTEVEHSCALCNSFRGTAYDLQKHVEQRHRVCGHHFLCPNMCKYLFDGKQKLLDHIQSGTCQGPSSSPSSGDKRKGFDVFYEEDEPAPKKVFEKLGNEDENRKLRIDSSRTGSVDRGDNNKEPAKWDDMMANIVADIDGFLSDEDGVDRTDKKSTRNKAAAHGENMEIVTEEKAEKESDEVEESVAKNEGAENIEDMDPQKIVLVEEESPLKPVAVYSKPEEAVTECNDDEVTENEEAKNDIEANQQDQTESQESGPANEEAEEQFEEEEEESEPEEEEDVVYEENSENDVAKSENRGMTSSASADGNPDDLVIDAQTEDESFTVEFS